MKKQSTVSDACITRRAIAYLSENGPMRLKPLTVSLKVSHTRLNAVLREAARTGRVNMIADGKREGETVYLFAVGTGARSMAERVSYRASENLNAFLATAAAHVEQLRARNPAMRGMYAA